MLYKQKMLTKLKAVEFQKYRPIVRTLTFIAPVLTHERYLNPNKCSQVRLSTCFYNTSSHLTRSAALFQ